MPVDVAPNVHNLVRGTIAPSSELPRSMNRDFQIRFTAGLLILLTTAAVVVAWINFQKESEFQVPYDGVWWVEQSGRLAAQRVESNGPGAKAGIKEGDVLAAINQREVNNTDGLVRQMYRAGAWSKANYSLVRESVPVDMVVILVPADKSLNYSLRLIALIYLGIGLYVLLRRWTAPGSTHFYIFCLVSFILYSFHYTGKLNGFDWAVYFGNVVAVSSTSTNTIPGGAGSAPIVGTSGAPGLRSREVIASARSLPARTCGIDTSTLSNIIETWPPTRSCTAGAAPLYGM